MNVPLDQLLAEAGAMALELRFLHRQNEELSARLGEAAPAERHNHTHPHGAAAHQDAAGGENTPG